MSLDIQLGPKENSYYILLMTLSIYIGKLRFKMTKRGKDLESNIDLKDAKPIIFYWLSTNAFSDCTKVCPYYLLGMYREEYKNGH